MPEASGVMFAAARLPGRSLQPKAAGEIHSRYLLAVRVLRGVAVGASRDGGQYLPQARRSEGSGLATGPSSGCGALRIRYFTGKMISVGGSS